MPEITDDDRLAAARAEMEEAGLWRLNSEPPQFGLLRRMGLAKRPPHYVPFWRSFLSNAVYFGAVWGLAMWLLFWRREGMDPGHALILAACAGGFYGLFMATWYRYTRRRHGLSRWEDLGRPSARTTGAARAGA